MNSSRFEVASANLERAVATLETATDETVHQSIIAVRNELQGAIALLVDGIQAAGEKSISAYESSSERVAKAVDGRMSDLTDRLSAELATLANRLPAEVESLNQAMIQIRTQIQRATRAMDDSVSQLAHRTPEAMREQLNAYDRALAKAMDHFSGTLDQWSEKVTAIEQFASDLRQSNMLRTAPHHTPLVPVTSPTTREPAAAAAS
jgi:paraquat-inducible protein B